MLSHVRYPEKFGVGITPDVKVTAISIVSKQTEYGYDQVVRLFWDLGDYSEPDIYGFGIFRNDLNKYIFRGFTSDTFFDDVLDFTDDFRILPSVFYTIVSFYSTINRNKAISVNQNDKVNIGRGFYVLANIDNSEGEAIVKLGNKEYKVSYPLALFISNRKKDLEVSFSSQSIPFLYLVAIGGVSDNASPISVDVVPENRLGNMLKNVLAEETRRLSEIYFPNFGESVLILSRKRFGTRCPVCYDQDTNLILDKHCKACYGTGIEGGYFRYKSYALFQFPRETWVVSPQDKGEWFGPRTYEIHLPATFPVRPLDIIVRESDGTRYKVGRVNYTRIAGALIEQTVSATLLDKNDPSYLISSDISTPEDITFDSDQSGNLQFSLTDYYNNVIRPVLNGVPVSKHKVLFVEE